MKKITVCFLLLATGLLSHDIDIEVAKLKPTCKMVKVGLYDSKDKFPIVSQAYKWANLEINSSSLKHRFENIPNGTYAVALFCDENRNGKLDTNFLGVPKEAYGFSNNPNIFGKPSFEDASFELHHHKNLKIELKQ